MAFIESPGTKTVVVMLLLLPTLLLHVHGARMGTAASLIVPRHLHEIYGANSVCHAGDEVPLLQQQQQRQQYHTACVRSLRSLYVRRAASHHRGMARGPLRRRARTGSGCCDGRWSFDGRSVIVG